MDHIGGVVFINLAYRTDRRREIEEELSKLPQALQNKVERFDAITGGLVGCLRSHRAVTELAVERGWESVLIFEDDCCWEPGALDGIEERLESFWRDYGHEFGFVQLGHGVYIDAAPEEHNGVRRVFNSANAVAYWLHRRAMQPLIDVYRPAEEPLEATGWHHIFQNDLVWNAIRPAYPCYALEPRLCFQRAGYSDLAGQVQEAR